MYMEFIIQYGEYQNKITKYISITKMWFNSVQLRYPVRIGVQVCLFLGNVRSVIEIVMTLMCTYLRSFIW